MISVAIADDQAGIRQYIRIMVEYQPDMEVVGEAGSGVETMRLVNGLHPDVLVLDLSLGDMDGMDVAHRLQSSAPETRVIIYSMYGFSGYLVKARQVGAKGYVLKQSNPQELVKAIKKVFSGELYYVSPLAPEPPEIIPPGL